MLVSLNVENLALVDRVSLSFSAGLNVVTGETGAGKSVLIGALKLLAGQRAEKGLIRSGADSCTVAATFQLPPESPVHALLAERALPVCEEGSLLLRRVIKNSGGSQFLNDMPVTLQVLKEVGELLVDMHGPHDQQSLFHAAAQLRVLDSFGGHAREQGAYASVYSALREIEERMKVLVGDGGNVAEQIDMLSYKIKEIEDADLSEEEFVSIRKEHDVAGNAQEIIQWGSAAIQALNEGETSAADHLGEALRALEKLSTLMADAAPIRDEVRQVTGQVRELGANLSSRLSDIDSNPERLDWLDERLGCYARLQKKYGPTIRDVLETLRASRERLRDLASRDERLAELVKLAEKKRAELSVAGKALSKARFSAGKTLSREVEKELTALGFRQSRFLVTLSASEPNASGLDVVEFVFAPNPGEPDRPLRQIASSGEMSRLMLAVKTVLARHDCIPVLVFDEVDANLGGETGHVVGEKLAAVARSHQVLCITHLPQVAVFGEQHFLVRKDLDGGRTLTRVQLLDSRKERVAEIARMLGGTGRTKVTETHAKELLAAAQERS